MKGLPSSKIDTHSTHAYHGSETVTQPQENTSPPRTESPQRQRSLTFQVLPRRPNPNQPELAGSAIVSPDVTVRPSSPNAASTAADVASSSRSGSFASFRSLPLGSAPQDGAALSYLHPDYRAQPDLGQLTDVHALVQLIDHKLDHLGRPEGGWYFEHSLGSLQALTAEHIKGIHEVLETTNDVKNILSFGARDGGFELAMQVRHDFDLLMGLHKKPDGNLAHNYLDAISLQSNSQTKVTKLEGMDVFKMQNPFWDIGYKNGIDNAKKMIFFITPEWLASAFCRQEFQWLKETKNKDIKSAFVMFDDVDKGNEVVRDVVGYAERQGSHVLNVASSDETDLHNVSIEGSKDLSFKRSMNSDQFEQIKNWVRDLS
ncbi:hypothetical protein [Ralstonia pseudosolanacearum]|uniref:hypothetical protein n=1 Tax=Ralstonia pseudosolanacearum TaxID=1310165 RepID=UPI001FF712EA|nr:hypothetical protein [Ralstonia pseudosolanacearum]